MNQEDFANRLFSMMSQLYGSDISGKIAQYFNQAQGNLMGQEQRDVGAAANQGYGQAASMNLSNPSSLMHRYMSEAYGRYAPQFGNLQTQQAQAMYQGNVGDRMKMLQMMMGLGELFPKPFSFAQDVLPGLTQAGGSIGAAYMGKH